MTQKSLISPQETRYYQTGWDTRTPPQPVLDGVGYRIAQVVPEGAEFPVSEPLYWTDCADNICADEFVFDPSDNSFQPALWEPIPVEQPAATGGIETL